METSIGIQNPIAEPEGLSEMHTQAQKPTASPPDMFLHAINLHDHTLRIAAFFQSHNYLVHPPDRQHNGFPIPARDPACFQQMEVGDSGVGSPVSNYAARGRTNYIEMHYWTASETGGHQTDTEKSTLER